jgi:glycerophosphoryl diester phosphodiesterase
LSAPVHPLFEQLPRPAIFAHRGASAHAPENTLAAFQLALHQGADGIELDAQLTADGQVVVFHDQEVSRTTQGKGRVRDLKLSQLKMLDAGSHFDIAFQGEPVPSLDEVLATLGQRTFINIELKNYSTILDRLPEKVVELIKFYNLTQRVLISSFNPIALRKVRRLAPEIAIGLLVLPGFYASLATSRLGKWIVPYDSLHLPLSVVRAKSTPPAAWVAQRIIVYTVDNPADIRKMIELNVCAMITNDPQLARNILSIYQRDHPRTFLHRKEKTNLPPNEW